MGYWNNLGSPATKVTWNNPQVTPESQRQSGGWYYNPGSGYVERWWSGSQPAVQSGGGGSNSNNQSSNQSSQGFQDLYKQQQIEAETRARELAAQQQTQFKGFQTEETGLLGKFTNALTSLEPVAAIRQRVGQELNLPSLREAAQGLQTTLNKIPENVKQLASQFAISAPRQQQRVTQQQTELSPAVTQAATAQQLAEEQMTTRVSDELTQQERSLAPIQQEFTILAGRIARETTGFSQSMQNELNLLLSKLQQTGTLATAEIQAARDLAIKEEETLKEKFKLLNTNQIEVLGGSKYLVNMATGARIYVGPAATGTGSTGDKFPGTQVKTVPDVNQNPQNDLIVNEQMLRGLSPEQQTTLNNELKTFGLGE